MEKERQYIPDTVIIHHKKGEYISDILKILSKNKGSPFLVYSEDGTTVQLSSEHYHPRDWWRYEPPLAHLNDVDRSGDNIYY